MNQLLRYTGLCAISLTLLAGKAIAQDQAAPPDSPLSGPAVKDGSVPGEARKLTGGKSTDRKEAKDRPLPHPMFMKAFDVLRGPDADKAIALTPDQNDDIEVLDEDFKQTMMKYRQDHMQEVQELRTKLTGDDRKKVDQFMRELGGRRGGPGGPGEKGGPGGKGGKGGKRGPGGPDREGPGGPDGDMPPPPPGEDMMMQDDAKAAPTDKAASENAMARLQEIRDGAPKPADLHAKLIAVLTDAQRPAFNTELAKIQGEWEQQQKERLAERYAEKGKGAGKGKGKGLGDGGPVTSIDDPRIPERMRDRLKDLPADQQQKALERINKRLSNNK
ncbi:MAG: hypothetical protein WC718_15750 [Phycisphaerales bacterium]|jgi:hypothetical protein